jgi:hypothetical protein
MHTWSAKSSDITDYFGFVSQNLQPLAAFFGQTHALRVFGAKGALVHTDPSSGAAWPVGARLMRAP